MKTAYLWIFSDFMTHRRPPRFEIVADLVFSSVEKFQELAKDSSLPESVVNLVLTEEFDPSFVGVCSQLVPIQVPDSFDRWDFIPDKY